MGLHETREKTCVVALIALLGCASENASSGGCTGSDAESSSSSGSTGALEDASTGTASGDSTTSPDDTGSSSTAIGPDETDGDEGSSSTGEPEPELRCGDIEAYTRTWWTGIGGEGEHPGGLAVGVSPQGALYVEERVDDVQTIIHLDESGESQSQWALTNGAGIGSRRHHGLFFGARGQVVAIGLSGGLWTAGLDLESQDVLWEDSLAFPDWASVPVDAAFGPDGSTYVTSQIEQLGPLVREIVLAKYSPDGARLWDTIVPNDALGTSNHMSMGVHVRDDGQVLVVNRSAVVVHRYDADGNDLGTVNDVLYGINGSPRFSGLDSQGRLVLGVSEGIGPGQDQAQIRRYDSNLEAQWEVQLPELGFANELMMGIDADDAIVTVHTFTEVPTLQRVIDGEVVLEQALDPLARTFSMSMVDDCSFVLTGASQDDEGDWQDWRMRFDPIVP